MQTKFLLPAVSGVAVGLVLYVLHIPAFLTVMAGLGTALILAVRSWERKNVKLSRGKARVASFR